MTGKVLANQRRWSWSRLIGTFDLNVMVLSVHFKSSLNISPLNNQLIRLISNTCYRRRTRYPPPKVKKKKKSKRNKRFFSLLGCDMIFLSARWVPSRSRKDDTTFYGCTSRQHACLQEFCGQIHIF